MVLRSQQCTLIEQIRADKTACVYRGFRDVDRRPVLVQVLTDEYPSVRDIARIRHEHVVAAELAIQGVVTPIALEANGHGLALIWDDPGGVSLRSLLSSGPLALGAALRIGASIARTLAAIHDRRIIHKDLTPEHVFVEVGAWQTHVYGFGIAARVSRETPLLASPSALEGALTYISPEQSGRMNRTVDRRSDLYSLGVILYEMLTGSPPFSTDDAITLLYSHLARQPEPPHERAPGLPRAVSDLVMKLLAKNAEDRYQYARAVEHDLRRCAAELDAAGAITAFPLAEDDRDRGSELDLPQRLYGREAELRALLSAWERVHAGATELLLVRGYSGIGKTALVSEIHRELTGARGYFLSGKFDQIGRTVPYAPLAVALRGLVHMLLTESQSELGRFRAELEAAVGANARALTEVVPDLERIIGPPPELSELGGAASRSRFVRACQQLLKVVTSSGRPLVLFLDDLQWADLASLELLTSILTGGVNDRLLVIGAYRTNEVDGSHPLTHALRSIEEGGAAVSAIELGPLSRGDARRFVADALSLSVEAASPLARILQSKTEGNPFFLIQLLVALHKDGQIYYDNVTRSYRWDEASVQAASASDNVLHFMTQRLGRLSASTGRALELAACIGHRFDLRTLSIIAESSPGAVARDLWPAIEGGMVVPLDPDYRFLESSAEATGGQTPLGFRFLHDRVQQAAYARISEGDLPALHLRIGRLLLSSRGADCGDDGLGALDVVSHLNLGRALMSDASERAALAELNLTAGRKARAATAYAAAKGYFAAGVSLLDATSFESRYALAFALYFGAAEAAMLSGGNDDAEASLEILLQRARSPLDRALVLDLRAVLSASRGRSADAVEAGLAGLRLLGFAVPDAETEQREAYERELALVSAQIARRGVDELAGAAPMVDPEQRAAMRLARHTALSAFGIKTTLGYWLTALAASLSLQHGSSDQSAPAYALLGAVVASSTARFAEAHQLVKLALAMHERRGGDVHEACMLGFYFTTVSHYAMHWRALLPYLERARVAGVESGDLLFHSYACSHRAIARLILGDPLDEVREEVERTRALMVKQKLAPAAATQTLVLRTIACLQGLTSGPAALDGEGEREDELLATIAGARMSFALYWYRTTKGALLYLAGDSEGAIEQLERTEAMVPIAFTPEARFFTALAILGLDAAHRPEAGAPRALLLERCRADYATWAEACPANYRHRRLLIEAEVARRDGDAERAMDLYDESIAAAESSGWPRDRALAEELAAKFYLLRGRERAARAYMSDAAYGYARWGAVARARALAERFPGMVPIEAQKPSPRALAASDVDDIDVLAFVHSLQLVAREVVLDDVVERLMHVVLQSAGADRAALILERDDALVVYATVTSKPPNVLLGRAALLDESGQLPATVIRYVARLSESVVLSDAPLDERFAKDPYIARAKPRSIACLPMTNQGRARGALYLENNVVAAAFTPRRLELLGLLSSQAVISIENADLYTRIQAATDSLARANAALEGEVERRTAELRAANEQLTAKFLEREQRERERVELEAARLAELSTPVIPLTRDILIIPLIGAIDHQRAIEVPQTILAGAYERGARVVIVDVTGVKGAGGAIVEVLTATTRALRLLGAQVIVTGVSADMAIVLVERGQDIAGLITCGNLEGGIARALGRAPRASRLATGAYARR